MLDRIDNAEKAPATFDGFFTSPVGETDPVLAAAMDRELGRQRHEIGLIASENIVSRAVLDAAGSVLTNKYAEGYPGKRYYGGCQFVDEVEELAIERARALFDCGYALVRQDTDDLLVRESCSLHCPSSSRSGL